MGDDHLIRTPRLFGLARFRELLITRRLDAPSATIQKFDCVYEAFTKLETALKREGF